MSLRAYSVNDDQGGNTDGSYGAVVWAERMTQAASTFVDSYEYRAESLEWGGPLRVEDVTTLAIIGGFNPTKAEPHIDGRKALERAAGFRYEGDRSCDTCGLYECDGEVPVCSECNQCRECGCECVPAAA